MIERVDWDELTPEDQIKAQSLLDQFNELLSRYDKLAEEEEKPCKDSTLND